MRFAGMWDMAGIACDINKDRKVDRGVEGCVLE